MAETPRVSTVIDQHVAVTERIRKLEIMNHSRVAVPRKWHPTEDTLDALTRLVIAVSPWAVPIAEDPDTGTRTPFPSMSAMVQRLHAILADPFNGWSAEAEPWNDFLVAVGALPLSYATLHTQTQSASAPDLRPSYLNDVVCSQEVVGDGSGHNSFNKIVYVYGLKAGDWFFVQPGYREFNAGRSTEPPIPGDTIYIDDPPRGINSGGSYIHVPVRPLPWTNTVFMMDNAIWASIPVSLPCGNTDETFADWPRMTGSEGAAILSMGPLGIVCVDHDSFSVAPGTGQWMALLGIGGADAFAISCPGKTEQLYAAPLAEAHDHVGPWPGYAEVRRRVEKYYPGQVGAWVDAWWDTALIPEHEGWQALDHLYVLRGKVEASVRDRWVQLRGFLHHPWKWDFGTVAYFSADEIPPPPYSPYPLNLRTERGDHVRAEVEKSLGNWADTPLWQINCSFTGDHPLQIEEEGKPMRVIFDGVSWQSDVLLY